MNILPFTITLAAGLATALGAVAGTFAGKKIQSVSLAFATGLMLMISMGELVPEASEVLGIPVSLLLLVLGACVSLFLDVVFPHEHEHEHDGEHEIIQEPGHYIHECECSHSETVSRGMITALLLHNIVEGLATGLTVENNTRLGLSMAIGIAIHNIPIGATLAVSVVSSGKSKIKAVLYSLLVGLSQPLGAIIGTAILGASVSDKILAGCMASVAGILVFISFDELWPAARKNGGRNLTIFSLLAGICFISLSEMIL